MRNIIWLILTESSHRSPLFSSKQASISEQQGQDVPPSFLPCLPLLLSWAHCPQSHQSSSATEVGHLTAEDRHSGREQTCPCSPPLAPHVRGLGQRQKLLSPALPGEEDARPRQQGLSTDCHSPVPPRAPNGPMMPTPKAVLFHRNYFFALFLLWLISPQLTTTF